ncbi:MAG: putative quinol monooxygenase [Dehalococcoidia bacterium]
MFVRVYAHYAVKGKEAEGKAEMAKFADEVKKSPDTIEIYKLVSRNDPTKITTAAVWKSKEAWQKWTDARKAATAQSGGGSTTVWVKVEGDDYDSY